MGLTVEYHLRLGAAPARKAQAIIRKLHRRASALPFDEVSPVEDFKFGYARTESRIPPWFRHAIEMHLERKHRQDVFPRRVFAFLVNPGPGCESATFGLVQFPKMMTLPGGRRVPTNLSGWSWFHFCKTEYAGTPPNGGFENFRRCHVSLVTLLDAARELGLRTKVRDESNFTTHRDPEKLLLAIVTPDEWAARFAGRRKYAGPGTSGSLIMQHPNFEHLEARGREKGP